VSARRPAGPAAGPPGPLRAPSATQCSGRARAGVWGDVGASGRRQPRPSDDDLQAQAWLPSCLTALLAEAERAAGAALAWEAEEGAARSAAGSAVASRAGSGCEGECAGEPGARRRGSGEAPAPSGAAPACRARRRARVAVDAP